MSSEIALIGIFPDYNDDGTINLNLPFSYGCLDLNLMGYLEIEELIKDIRNKLKREEKNEESI